MEWAPSIDFPVVASGSIQKSFPQRILWLTLGLIGKEVVHLGDSSVESNDFVPVVSGVENQVLAHHGQADQTEISSGFIVS
jgi:hypothetical protein